MKRGLLLCFLLLLEVTVVAQNSITYKGETINRLDTEGNKTGLWKIYNERNNVLITVDFDNGGKINFYKDAVLIATYDKTVLEIYKDSKTIKAKFFYKEDKSQTLVDENGKELDSASIKYYAQAAESYPMFYGGSEQLYAFIGENFNKKKKDRGTIKVKFVIDPNGFAKDITVVDSTIPELNDEAIRVVSMLPRWQPGFQRLKFVNVAYTVPIVLQ